MAAGRGRGWFQGAGGTCSVGGCGGTGRARGAEAPGQEVRERVPTGAGRGAGLGHPQAEPAGAPGTGCRGPGWSALPESSSSCCWQHRPTLRAGGQHGHGRPGRSLEERAGCWPGWGGRAVPLPPSLPPRRAEAARPPRSGQGVQAQPWARGTGSGPGRWRCSRAATRTNETQTATPAEETNAPLLLQARPGGKRRLLPDGASRLQPFQAGHVLHRAEDPQVTSCMEVLEVPLPGWHREERRREGGHSWTPAPATAGNRWPEKAPRSPGKGPCSMLQRKAKKPPGPVPICPGEKTPS